MSYIGSEQVCNRPLFRFRCRVATKVMAKNLFSDFTEEPECEEAVKVFLRLKPNKSSQHESLIEVLNARTLIFKTPSAYIQTRRKLNMPDQYKYTFSKIFQPDATQDDIFKGCVVQHITDLFAGQHCLLFTYGTTNAGKTFTVLGNGDQPGIIPRSLTTIFKSIGNKRYTNARIMPHMFNSVIEITNKNLNEEMTFKNRILMWNPDRTQGDTCKSYNATTTRSSFEELLDEPVFRQMQSRLTSDTVEVDFESEPDDRFSVWVSFAEIYNEAIFDLLQPITQNSRRQQLKICRDNSKNFYIKGLKHVFIENEEEAYKVLRFGKNHLQVAATGINSSSSRSHCIFSIKLMKCPNVEHPEKVAVSSFSICDLAGAERQKKTLNDGMRLKESQNINSSLMVLSRCFSIIRENQTANEQKLVPFRESKLTQLFQHALMGKESVTMIVNVNSEQYLYEETQHVLKASAIAKDIVVQPPMQRPARQTRQSSFSRLTLKNKKNRSTLIRWDSCVRPNAPTLETILGSVDETSVLGQKQEKYEDLLILVESLKVKLKEEKEKALQIRKNWRKREDEIRDEMRQEIDSMLEKAREQNESDQKRILETKSCKENIKRPLEEITNNTAKYARVENLERLKDENRLVLTPNVKDLEDELKIQKTEIEGLINLVELFKEEKKELTMDLTLSKFHLSVKDKEIDNLKKKLEILGDESELKAAYLELEKEMESRLKQRDDLLEEARMDFLDELAVREDNEEEIKRLENEVHVKNQKIATLLMQIEEMTEDIEIKSKTIDLLYKQMEEEEMEFEEKIQKLKRELAEKTESHQNEIDSLKREKSALDERLVKLQEEFNAHREEAEAKIESQSLNQAANDSVDNEEVKEALRKEIEAEQDERITEVIINMTEDYELKIEELKQQFQSQKSELEQKYLDQTLRLESESKSKEHLMEELKVAQGTLSVAQQELAENGKKISELEKYFESEQIKHDEDLKKYTSEVSILEKSLKEQIREVTKVSSFQKGKNEEISKMSQELVECRTAIESLKNTLKTKEHDLECCRSQLMGYEKSVPTLQASFGRQQSEIAEYKRKCEDLMSNIINMEQEQSSFQSNQKEIIGKYEDQLKKAKDEIDTLKKEIARLTNTFYKSTPTPKKDLEMQIENLKKQLEEERTTREKLEEEKKLSVLRFPDGPNKENEYVFESAVEVSRLRPRAVDQPAGAATRLRSHSTTEELKHQPNEGESCSKSASKVRTRKNTRLQAPTAIPKIDNTSADNVAKKSTKQLRKKLWDPKSHDETSLPIDSVEFETNVPQDSPGTIVKRNLRKRNK